MPASLPHWDMSVVYPGLDSPEYQQSIESIKNTITQTQQVFDQLHIQRLDAPPPTTAAAANMDWLLPQLNAVIEALSVINAYTNAFVSVDSRDSLAQSKMSELQKVNLSWSLLMTRFHAWVGSLDVDAIVDQSEIAAQHAYMLRLAKDNAQHMMPPLEEVLAEELVLTGSSAWSKLYMVVSSQLMAEITVDAKTQKLPMSVIRNLAYSPNSEERKAAYEAELVGWQTVAPVLAASLNSIKGEVNTLANHRGWKTALEASIAQAHIDQEIFDVMMRAAKDSFPDFRRYLQAKAAYLGKEKLPWYDLFAPVGQSSRDWKFEESAAFIIEQFAAYSPKMGDFAARAFREHWIDAEPRAGKRDGAFCMRLRRDESRILSNYKESYSGMKTLAHELGHGYHNLNLADKTPLQKITPMTLAETASIFCETLVKEGALRSASRSEQIEILQESLQSATQQIMDITSRFLFEQTVFQNRLARDLTVDELNEAMLAAQREAYGNGLDDRYLHPYMWAAKNHYYSGSRSYYNFPYMFGLLFGTGIYAAFKDDPALFRKNYDTLLASTGMGDAAELAARFGVDLRSYAFWQSSLDVIRGDINTFISLIG